MSDVLLTYLLHSTVILGLTLAALRLPGLRSAALRDVALKVALLAGVVTASVAPLHLPALALATPGPTQAAPDERPAPPVDTGPAEPTATVATLPPLGAAGHLVDWTDALVLGSLLFTVVRFGLAFAQLRRADLGRVDAVDVVGLLTPGDRTALRWTRLAVPCALGSRHILVPHDIRQRLDAAELRAVLAYEQAHLRRRDPLWNLGLSFLTQLAWFQPLNWLALHTWRGAAEERCDTWATRRVPRLTLAQALLTLGREGHASAPTMLTAQAAQPSLLSRRIHALLTPEEPRMPNAQLYVLALLPALLGSALPPLALAATPARTVVIDAGHGGNDQGAVGVQAAAEADITLAVARKVQARLEAQGVTVILTRDDGRIPNPADKMQNLQARLARVPASAQAFVSIHANVSDRADERGVVTYFPWAFSKVAGPSMTLARSVQTAVVASTSAPDRGMTSGDFYVLRNAKIPAILIEVGYVSNPTEAASLLDAGYQDRLAEGIVRGVLARP